MKTTTFVFVIHNMNIYIVLYPSESKKAPYTHKLIIKHIKTLNQLLFHLMNHMLNCWFYPLELINNHKNRVFFFTFKTAESMYDARCCFKALSSTITRFNFSNETISLSYIMDKTHAFAKTKMHWLDLYTFLYFHLLILIARSLFILTQHTTLCTSVFTGFKNCLALYKDGHSNNKQ